MADQPVTIPIDVQILKDYVLLTAGQVLASKDLASLGQSSDPVGIKLREYVPAAEQLYLAALGKAVGGMYSFVQLLVQNPGLCHLYTDERRLIAHALQAYEDASLQVTAVMKEKYGVDMIAQGLAQHFNWSGLNEQFMSLGS